MVPIDENPLLQATGQHGESMQSLGIIRSAYENCLVYNIKFRG